MRDVVSLHALLFIGRGGNLDGFCRFDPLGDLREIEL
jgi:hypothetical protein